jgi:hypothetical protein
MASSIRATPAPIPNEFLCPITLGMMGDPVVAADGHSYERAAIEKWIAENSVQQQQYYGYGGTISVVNSPKTGSPLSSTNLIPNYALRSQIQDFVARNGAVAAGSYARAAPLFVDLPVTMDAETFNYDSKRYFKLSVKALPPPKRQPITIIVIADNSGSMAENAEEEKAVEKFGFTRQDLVGHAINTTAAILGPDDMLAIIKFSTGGQVVLRPTLMTADGRARVKSAVETIHPDSQTNIYEGCRLANEMANNSEMAGRHIVALLLTDGFPNVNPPRGIVETLRTLPRGNPWSLSTFGFGSNLDSVLLSELAAWGGGRFGFIPDCTMVGTVFINYLASMLATAAKNATITVNGRVIQTGPIQFGQSRDFIFGDDWREQPHFTLNSQDAIIVDAEMSPENMVALVRHEFIGAIKESIALAKNYTDGRQLAPLERVYARFSSTDNAAVKKILRDIKSEVDSEGQLSLALAAAYFSKWGQHYLRAYLMAQEMQQCMNFKDPGGQIYGGQSFMEFQALGDTAFTTLPPPKPSGIVPSAGGYGGAYAPSATPLSMASFHNPSGGCFNATTLVIMGCGGSKQISEIQAGESVLTPFGPVEVTAVVVCGSKMTSQPMVQIESLSITPWHPIQVGGKWVFPASIAPYTSRPISTVYNLVLPSIHIIYAEGFECCTLGHTYTGPVIGHEFFGSERVIDALKRLPSWASGRPTFTNLKAIRDEKTGGIVDWIDDV